MLEEVKTSVGCFDEIDAILAVIEDARSRAEEAIPKLREDGAEKPLLEALKYAEEELAAAGKRLMQRTVFVTSGASLTA